MRDVPEIRNMKDVNLFNVKRDFYHEDEAIKSAVFENDSLEKGSQRLDKRR